MSSQSLIINHTASITTVKSVRAALKVPEEKIKCGTDILLEGFLYQGCQLVSDNDKCGATYMSLETTKHYIRLGDFRGKRHEVKHDGILVLLPLRIFWTFLIFSL